MAPIQLPGNTPILYIFHPVFVNILKLSRIKANGIVHHRFQGRFGHFLHPAEPLVRKLGLNDTVCSLRKANVILDGFCLL